MKIIVAKNSGFCFGVRSAVETAEKNAGPHTYTYGDIIHNERVLADLSRKGVKSVENVSSITDADATVIIRSHGAKKSVYDQIRERGFKLIDATCPFVKKIHSIVNEYLNKGYRIFIIGAASHRNKRLVRRHGYGYRRKLRFFFSRPRRKSLFCRADYVFNRKICRYIKKNSQTLFQNS